MAKLIIDDELRAALPPLTTEEYERLEAGLLEVGRATDDLVVWKGHGIIVDGMNRFEICERHNLQYDVLERDFASRAEVIQWMFRRQLGRRNLTDEQRTYFIGKLYNENKREHGGDRKTATEPEEKSSGHDVHLKSADGEGSTAANIADEQNVSARTVARAGTFAQAVDEVSELVGPEARAVLLGGSVDVSAASVEQLAALSKSKAAKAIKALAGGKAKSVKEALRQVAPQQEVAGAKSGKTRGRSAEPQSAATGKLAKAIKIHGALVRELDNVMSLAGGHTVRSREIMATLNTAHQKMMSLNRLLSAKGK